MRFFRSINPCKACVARLAAGIVLVFGVILASPTSAQIQLPTLEQALELSQKTGAPILAMAGRKT